MKKVFGALLTSVLIGCAGSTSAQPMTIDTWTPPLASQSARDAANVISTGTVLTMMALDFHDAWTSDDRRQDVELLAARWFVTWGLSSLAKGLVDRDRPCVPTCGMERPNTSFYSGHTAFAFSGLGGPRLAIALPLAVSSGGLRIAAGKHYLTDVLAGAAAGAMASRIRRHQ